MDSKQKQRIWIGVAALVGSLLLLRYMQGSSTDSSGSGGQPSTSTPTIKEKEESEEQESTTSASEVREIRVTILYGTTTGTARGFASTLQNYLLRCCTSLLQQCGEMRKYIFDLVDIADYNEDSLESEDIVIFLVSTWEGGSCPESCALFFDWVQDYACDFRVSKSFLSKVRFAVFGLGGELYGDNYAKAAKDLDENIATLGANRLLPVAVGDDASNLEDRFQLWRDAITCRVLGISSVQQLKAMQLQQNAELQAAGRRLATAAAANRSSGDVDDSASIASTSTADISRRQQKKMVRKELQNVRKQQEKAAKASGSAVAAQPVGPSNRKVAIVGSNSNSKSGSFSNSSAINETPVNTSNSSCCGGGGDAAKKSADSCGCGNASNSGVLANRSSVVDDEEEEDRINNYFITMDQLDEAYFAAARAAAAGAKAETAEDKALLAMQLTSSAEGNAARATRKAAPAKKTTGEKTALMDVEDIGSSMAAASEQQRKDLTLSLKGADGNADETAVAVDDRREMATKLQRKALTKEGYKLIGTHSAVKLCRWTKHQLRGRGGCYKHTFYGITSYQCMEATPSLACANKCVFCWRHHKNPVGTEWRWKEDAPDFIVEEAITLHRKMINEFRGAPGVQPERLLEAFTVRHCALSLVGEPIMYPRINEMLTELHKRDISTFLVTNAQFPEQIRSLLPITQLYVSVDAATRDSLKAVDRPLFADFWDRFIGSLVALKEKRQRTVYRMTLVKDWNMSEAEGYAELIELGQPDLIEIKSVTYCGKSDASSLTMEHVPWHHETCAYAEALATRLQQRGMLPFRYEIATEHQHSCCILLARTDKYKIDGVWHTWIDYPKFHALMRRYYASNGEETFVSSDYLAPTPAWALYKAPEHGFDPVDERFYRNKTTKQLEEIPYEASESGCG